MLNLTDAEARSLRDALDGLPELVSVGRKLDRALGPDAAPVIPGQTEIGDYMEVDDGVQERSAA